MLHVVTKGLENCVQYSKLLTGKMPAYWVVLYYVVLQTVSQNRVLYLAIGAAL